MKTYFPALLALIFLSACTKNLKEPIKVEKIAPYTFNAVGYAPIDIQPGSRSEVKILNAIKASKIDAYKEMAEQIYGVLLTSKSSVLEATLQDDKIRAEVRGLVKGAKVIKSYHEGDLYITELELNMATLPHLRAATFSEEEISESIYY